MKQTAVDWLIDEAMKLLIQYMDGTLNEDTLDEDVYRIGMKAKEMEKNRTLDFGEFIIDELEPMSQNREWVEQRYNYFKSE